MKKIYSAIFYLAYLASRLVNLSAIPLFNDEAFFLWAGKQIVLDPFRNFFINYSDGKEPLFFWIYSLANLFPDPLLALRLFSIFFGLLTLIYVRKITNNIFATILFIANPFLLFYQRLGMQETLLTFLLTASLFYSLKNRKIMAGIFIGLSLITKTTALAFFTILIPILVWHRNFVSLAVVALIYLPIFIGVGKIAGHNQSYAGLISIEQMFINYKQAARWLWEYMGPLGLVGAISPPVILESLIAKIFFPRYFLFIVPALIVFISKYVPKFLLVLLLVPNLILSYQIVNHVESAGLPYIEKWQYLEAWPAGYGIKEVANYLKAENIRSVYTEDIMITANGLQYYYPVLETKPLSSGSNGYFVFKKSSEKANELGLIKLYNSYDVSVYRSRLSTQ